MGVDFAHHVALSAYAPAPAPHLIAIAREAGLTALVADVLPENRAMRAVFKRLGFVTEAKRDPDTIHLVLDLKGSPQADAAPR